MGALTVHDLHKRLLDEARRAAAPARPSFTDLEKSQIKMLAIGMTYAEIGEACGLTRRATRYDVETIARKLGVRYRRRIPVAYMALTGDNPYPRGAGRVRVDA